MRILITGAGGFIGRHLAPALEGHEVLTPGRAELDVLSGETPPAADLLIHLAWVTEHGKFWHAPENAAWEEASFRLFEQFLANGGRRIIGLGTCAEYDWSTGAGAFAEDAPLAPHTPYGAAKVRTAERLASLAARQNASWAWGRVFFLFGAGEPPGRLIPLMLSAVREGTPLGIGPGAAVRDFWDVRNLGAAIAALALSDLNGPVNLASGQGISFSDLARMIEHLTSTSGIIQPDQRALGPGEPVSLVADTTRLLGEVGFRAPKTVEAGLADYLGV